MTTRISAIACLLLLSAAGSLAAKDWWETAQFYQIYPRSFMDSNGDGVGDLNGVTQRLPYLKDLNITAFWLSPIFASPMADFGYDISDFFSIQPEYGTMADFIALVAKAKELGLKVILDFVPNHSSDENQWFINSVNRVPGYEDFYIWHDGQPNPNNASAPLPPNNWISTFRGSAWQWNSVRKQYYYHQFLVKQPDLNYRNPVVVDMMKSVLSFWMDRGVDGFRIDAVPSLFEIEADASGNYADEPVGPWTTDTDDWRYLNHTLTIDQPETIGMVYQWRALMDKYQAENGGETRVIMTEAYSPIEILMQYYGNGTMDGAHMPFNFQIISQLSGNSTAQNFKTTVDNWLTSLPAGKTSNWVMGNHDNNRIASRYGADRVDIMNMILLTLPGASVNYNGEEIGMTDLTLTWEQTVDPQACNSNPTLYAGLSRDPERTPFQWDNTTSAGFSTNSSTWLPVNPNYLTLNAASQNATAKSHLNVYKDLVKIRQTEVLMNGNISTIAVDNDVFVITRNISKDIYVTVTNMGTTAKTVDLSTHIADITQYTYEVVGVSSTHEKGATVSASNVVVNAKEGFVLRSGAEASLWLATGNQRFYLMGAIFLFYRCVS